MTLYLFMPDNRSSHSTCYGVCAVQWPPVILPQGATAAIAGPGIDPALLSVAPRKGQTAGGLQVNYNGWSLYTWPGDTAPGQATGQGLNNLGGLWYVVSPRATPFGSGTEPRARRHCSPKEAAQHSSGLLADPYASRLVQPVIDESGVLGFVKL